MAESNATQVILTDDGIKIINAQNTADNAAGGVTNLNDPNLMNVIEKQTQASQYAGLTSQYNVVLARAKEANVSTTALTTAYTNLNTFMGSVLADTTVASDVDRDTYKRLTDAYNTALSNVQTALNNSFNTDISNMQSSVSVASQAASSAVIVASQAATTGDNASHVASQAAVVASQAQIAGNNATSVANNASQASSKAILAGSTAAVKADKAITAASQAQIAGNNATSVANNASQAADNAILAGSTATVNANKAITVASQAQIAGDNATSVANVASQAASGAVIAGSQATVTANKAINVASQAQIAGNNATSVANSASQAASNAILAGSTATASANKASADYQTLSSGVKDGSVVHITTETVIDKEVIGTAEIANGAITNAQIGKEAVGSAQIAELAVGTAQIGDGAITNAKIGKLAVGTAQIADGAITNAQIGSEAVGSAQIGKEAVGSAQIADLAVGTAQIGDGAITNAKIGKLAVGTAQIANGAITNAQIGNAAIDTANIKDAAISSAKIANLAVGTAQIGDGAITNAKIGKLAVGTAQIANGAITDAQIGSLAVGTAQIKDEAVNSAKIASLAVGTAQIGDGAITNAKIGNLAVGTAQIANAAITDAQIGDVSANKLTAGTIDFHTITGKNINASNITTGKLSTERLNVDKLSAVSANLGDITTGSLKGVNIVAKTFSTPNGSFTTDENGSVVASNLTIRGVTNLVYNAALLGGVGSSIPGWGLNGEPYYSSVVLFDGLPAITWNGDATGRWDNYATSKLQPVTQTGIPYSASIKFRDYGSASGMLYTFTLGFFSAYDANTRVGYLQQVYTANGSDSGIQTFTVNNAIAPSNAKYVAIQLYAYNGKGHAAFSSPMLTQTAQATGYQPDTGNIVNAGIINGSTITASTINGGTINGITINGATINTPNLDLGTNGTLTTDFNINQDTSLYGPKKGTGTLTIKTGVINYSSDNMSRYSNTVNYWYGFDDNGHVVKDGTNHTGDDYAPGYEKHDIMKSNGTVLNRSYLDAMGLMFSEGGNSAYNTILTGVGLETATALLHKDLTTNGTFEASLGANGTYGFTIGSKVIAPMVQANQVTYSANMFISRNGYMATSTSTKANKLDIVDVPDMLQKGYNLLTLNPRQWFDKTSVEAYADVQAGNTDSVESVVDIKPVTGMVAEEVASAGLDDYVIKGENNEVQGLAYDRLWTLLIPVLRDMNDRLNEAQLEITKLKRGCLK
ncbi:beta strand repeat-containing protein [Lactiplantibacillus argentoratensis]